MEPLVIAAGLTSLALGIAMTFIAWRIVRDNRERETARVQLLSELAFPPAPESPPLDRHAASSDEAVTSDLEERFDMDAFLSETELRAMTSVPPPIANGADAPSPPQTTLFEAPPASGAPSRRRMAFAAVALVVMLAVATYAWVYGETASAARQEAATSVTLPATSEPQLELLALRHSLTPEAFVVTGRVRNQASAAPLGDLVAVVNVFDRTDRLINTTRAFIEDSALAPGESSGFTVSVPGVPDVRRYRVEFRVNGKDPIPHIDVRGAATK
jgi:hypothetical protein